MCAPGGLPLGSRQLLSRSGEPSRTSFDISTPSGQASQPIFAGYAAKEDDYLLLEMPLFPDPSQDGADDAAKPDNSGAEPTERSGDATPSQLDWSDN